ncbi:MAG: hypothetical protein CBC04_01405, partial [Verrucomicrobia bacterium TMED44]
MFRGGGEAVPNQYKGFSKLPENVQQKMNPALAKRYQQGGIASMMDPASMPQGNPMAGGQMDPAQMAMMEAEQAGRAQGEQLGAMVGQKTMAGLDQAEDFQGAIDALRGNSAPLEARYQELAGFVGNQDAMQTPESVLAMVQPTIMMTEEGAVDSGIGQLMQQITGNTAMETPDGQPTAMAEGVGSLMGVGQQPAEKKLLADGGAVQKYQLGGGVVPMTDYQTSQLPQYLQETQKFYKDILGDPQEQKKAMQANILFNLADRGLALAGGVDPRTGESMAGAPILSQLGRAGAGLGGQIGEQLAQQRALEQNIGLQALKSAEAKEAARLLAIQGERKITLEQANKIEQMNLNQLFNKDNMTSSQDHAKTLQAALFDHQKVLEDQKFNNLQLTKSQERDFQEKIIRIKTEINKNAVAVEHEQQVKMLGLKSEADINRDINNIEKSGEVQKDLTKLKAQLSSQESDIQRGHEVAQLATQIASKEKIALDSNELQILLQEKVQNFKLGENEKDRLFKASESALNRALQEGLQKDSQEFKFLFQEIANDFQLSESAQNRLFQANQNYFDRLQKDQLQASDQAFRQILADQNIELTISESAKDRALKSGTGYLERALKERGLSIQEATLQMNKDYNERIATVKELEAQALNLGKKSDTASMLYITNNVDGYNAGTLGITEKRLFEMVVENYTSPRYDHETGTTTSKGLPQEIRNSIETSRFNVAPPTVGGVGPTIEAANDQRVQNVENFQQNFEAQGGYGNEDARKSLISNIFKDGVVDLNSEYWSLVPTKLVEPDINYQDARGLLSAIPRTGVFLTRLGRDLFGGEPESGKQREFSEAETRIGNLHNKLLSLSNRNLEVVSGSDGRTLKSVQDQLAATIAPLKGKFTFSETMRDTLSGASSKLANQMQVLADVLEEYGGNSEGYTEAQVTKARNYMQDLVITTAEVLALKRAFDDGKRVLSQSSTSRGNNIFKK